MPGPKLHHSNIANPAAAEALQSYSADRDRLKAEWVDCCQKNSAIVAAWHYGSFGRGEADDVSDVDTWLVVRDDCFPGFERWVAGASNSLGTIIDIQSVPHNAPPEGGFAWVTFETRHGPVVFDFSWQPTSVALADGTERLMLFDRRNGPTSESPVQFMPEIDIPTRGESIPEKVVQRLSFVWLMLLVSGKYLARDPESDMKLMLYPMNAFQESAEMLDSASVLQTTSWIIPDGRQEKLNWLRHLADSTDRLTQIAIAAGILFSERHKPCIDRFLNMIEKTYEIKR